MQFKKILNIRVLFFLAFLFTGLIAGGLCFYSILPGVVESQLNKRLPHFLDSIVNPSYVSFDIQKIGLFNTFVSKINISKGLSINSVNIDYDILGLSSINLKTLTISGLTIHANLDQNNQFQILGIKMPKGSSKSSGDQTGPQKNDFSFLSFLPQRIVFKNSRMILNAVNDEFLIPFDVLANIGVKEEKITLQALVYPFGEKFNTSLTFDMTKGLEYIKIEGKSFNLKQIDQFISKKTNHVNINGLSDISLVSFSPKKEWKVSVSQIAIEQKINASIKALTTFLLIDNQKITANGIFNISQALLPEIKMKFKAGIDLKKDYPFEFYLENEKTQDINIEYESQHLSMINPEFKAKIHGTIKESQGKITLNTKQGRIRYKQDDIIFSNTQINADIAADYTDNGNGLSSKLSLKTNNISIKSDLGDAFFPKADISGMIAFDKGNKPFADGRLMLLNGKISSSKFKTKLAGINVNIPVSYPVSTKKEYGNYTIASILYDDQHNFSSKGKILQTGSREFTINGKVSLLSLPDVKTRFTSNIGLKNGLSAIVDFKTNQFKLGFKDIEKISVKNLQTADVDMKVEATGQAKFINHQLKTRMQVKINNGNISIPDINLTATGIKTIVNFNDLLVPETVPGQVLTIDSIKVNKIKIRDTRIRFSIEDAKSLLVENIKFKWCNGLVTTEAIRLPQKDNSYSLSLYCDRLELTQLLEQMGAFNAEGSGTLNGKIPVIYSEGNISFDNGFLFSTPGSGGKVVVKNADRITAGIPMDSPQFSQLDLAQEALKDFDYKWAKLKFNTFEDILYVNIELDGKPSKLMPFEYKREFGGFVRVDASNPGSHFQGIKLDVNLKLPFNEVIKFGNKLKSIFN